MCVREGGSEDGEVIPPACGDRWRKERERNDLVVLATLLFSSSVTSLLPLPSILHHVVCNRVRQISLRPMWISLFVKKQ